MLEQPSSRRLRPVRLSSIPLEQRRRAAAPLFREAAENGNLLLAVELQKAVEKPSEQVYWIAA
jgi:hypothetical protein